MDDAPAQKSTQSAEESKEPRFTRLGIAGLVIGMLAMVGAFTSPWIVDLLEPEPRPIEEVAADAAVRIKERITSKLKGEADAPAAARDDGRNWSSIVSVTVIGAGVLAACIGVVGFVRRDDIRLSGATISLGVAAAVFQFVLLLAAAILVILLIGIILAALGFSP